MTADRLQIIDDLGIPGIVDVHTHFMPEPVMQKVWAVFDQAQSVYGVPWPIEYRETAGVRLEVLRSFGVKAFTSMIYAHKPGMAAWLNRWSADFAAATPDCIQTATFYPERGVEDYVQGALEAGARCFKLHVQVGAFDPRDPQLDPAWGLLEDSATPIVIHCGSGPVPGEYTGPAPIRDVLAAHPGLQLIVAHMGAPEYGDFMDLADRYTGVRLDTTMAFTAFMNQLAPFPYALKDRLRDAGLRGDVLFGSDFPNIPYPYAEAVDSLAELGLGDAWLREVLWGAGARLFGIGG
ncbi:MAG: amidohydrolase family protein [Candidatus Nanopelagicales bacterium]